MKKLIKLCLISILSISLFLCLSEIAQARGRGSGYRSSGYRSYKNSGGYKSSSFGSKSIKVKSSYHKSGSYSSSLYRLTQSSKSKSYSPTKFTKSYTPSYNVGVQRDSQGHIKRSSSAKREFLKSNGYNKVPEGYEVDHIVPLYKGGADDPSNMQLLPKDVHKEKTRMDLSK
jgi:hypothetical protein